MFFNFPDEHLLARCPVLPHLWHNRFSIASQKPPHIFYSTFEAFGVKMVHQGSKEMRVRRGRRNQQRSPHVLVPRRVSEVKEDFCNVLNSEWSVRGEGS
jgi:hypothetical protein